MAKQEIMICPACGKSRHYLPHGSSEPLCGKCYVEKREAELKAIEGANQAAAARKLQNPRRLNEACRRGHSEWRYYVGKGGRVERYCLICRRERGRQVRAK